MEGPVSTAGNGGLFHVIAYLLLWFVRQIGHGLYFILHPRVTFPIAFGGSLAGVLLLCGTFWACSDGHGSDELHNPAWRWVAVLWSWFSIRPYVSWFTPIRFERWMVATPTTDLGAASTGDWLKHLAALWLVFLIAYYLYIGIAMGFWVVFRDLYRGALMVWRAPHQRAILWIFCAAVIELYLIAPWMFLWYWFSQIAAPPYPAGLSLFLQLRQPFPPLLVTYIVSHDVAVLNSLIPTISGVFVIGEGLFVLCEMVVVLILSGAFHFLTTWIRPPVSSTESWWQERTPPL
ncbi:MAG: hypothetical protein ACR2OU_20705 [Thermomicrobiales bacterium]